MLFNNLLTFWNWTLLSLYRTILHQCDSLTNYQITLPPNTHTDTAPHISCKHTRTHTNTSLNPVLPTHTYTNSSAQRTHWYVTDALPTNACTYNGSPQHIHWYITRALPQPSNTHHPHTFNTRKHTHRKCRPLKMTLWLCWTLWLTYNMQASKMILFLAPEILKTLRCSFQIIRSAETNKQVHQNTLKLVCFFFS